MDRIKEKYTKIEVNGCTLSVWLVVGNQSFCVAEDYDRDTEMNAAEWVRDMLTKAIKRIIDDEWLKRESAENEALEDIIVKLDNENERLSKEVASAGNDQ